MDKPINLIYAETEEKIVQTINDSKLPAFILRYTIEKILNQLIDLEQKQLMESQNEYKKKARKEIEK